MPRKLPRKLKVFRTAVGFRDAYVAAPSRAAALRAWGTDKDLFARGAAEEVTDAELGAEALHKPGEVVYRTRGGLKEQVAALGKLPAKKSPKSGAKAETKTKAAAEPEKPAKPRPSRAKVDAAEAAIEQHEREQEREERAMQDRERALAGERAAMESRFARELKQLRAKLEAAKAAYREALDLWEP
ncbi:hypothetical protein [Novosphingobium sp. 9U]|uniref:hypothetical protein n=1 Tax=Novosphingobium sp. 9U TaxID=2653158 RepID=UPI0012F13990|nr:hypothetical protein [Novosphingobium sp. 9U]VWX53776.1 conserved hypothetical protein [Novosphingobium sp. 9U]